MGFNFIIRNPNSTKVKTTMKTVRNHSEALPQIKMTTESTKASGETKTYHKKKKNVHFVQSRIIRGIMTQVGKKKKTKLQILLDRVHRSGQKFMETSYRIDAKQNRIHRSGKNYDYLPKVFEGKRPTTTADGVSGEDSSFGMFSGGTTIPLPENHSEANDTASSPEGMTVWKQEQDGDGNESDSTLE